MRGLEGRHKQVVMAQRVKALQGSPGLAQLVWSLLLEKRLKEAGESSLVCLLSSCPCCMLLVLPSGIVLACLTALDILLHKCHLPQSEATAYKYKGMRFSAAFQIRSFLVQEVTLHCAV